MIASISLDALSPEIVSRRGVVRVELGCRLSPEGLLEIAGRLGKPEGFVLPKYRPAGFPLEVTLIDSHGDGITSAPRGFGQGWHQDSTYMAKPPQFTVLHSLEVPAEGGDTHFADTRAALKTLPAEDLSALALLRLEHSVRDSYKIGAADVGRGIDEVRRSLPSAMHPALVAHPNGEVCLCLSPLYTQGSLSEGARPLFERAMREVVTSKTTHRWKAGELLVWDNRVVLHAASGYSGAERRRLIRTMVRAGAA